MKKTKEKSSNTEYIGVTLPPHLAAKLRAAAKREHRSVSNMLAVFLERGDNHLHRTDMIGDSNIKSA